MNKFVKNIKFAALAAPVYAQNEVKVGLPAGFENLGKMNINTLISGLIGFLMIATTIIFFFMLVMAGIKWITSEGDEKKVGAARLQLTNALVGLAIVFAAWAILQLLQTAFGFSLTGGLTIPKFY